MYKISDEVINFIEKIMKTRWVEVTEERKAKLKQRSKGVKSKEMHYHYL